jgi:hypothetical protein
VKLEHNQTAIYFEPRGAQTALPTACTVSTTDIATDMDRPLLAPFNTQFGHTGIVANDCTLAISAENEATTCTFTKLKYAIKANNSNVQIRHTAIFKDIADWNNPTATTDATAIWLENNSAWSLLANIGGIGKVYIWGADRGVYLNNASASFYNMTIGTNTLNNKPTIKGVEAYNGINKTVLLDYGSITTQGTGINFNNNTAGEYTVRNVGVTAGTAANVLGNYGIFINHSKNVVAPI